MALYPIILGARRSGRKTTAYSNKHDKGGPNIGKAVPGLGQNRQAPGDGQRQVEPGGDERRPYANIQ